MIKTKTLQQSPTSKQELDTFLVELMSDNDRAIEVYRLEFNKKKCFEYLVKMQEIKKQISENFDGEWYKLSLPLLLPFLADKNLTERLDLQEQELANIVKQEIIKKLSLDKQSRLEWSYGGFNIRGVDDIVIDKDFFKIIGEYCIRFDQCSFISPKATIIKDEGHSNIQRHTIHFEKTTIQYAFFQECTFKTSLIFDSTTFEQDCIFSICHFKSLAQFKKCIFKGKTHFERSIFEEIANFSESIFEKETFFHSKETTFKKKADFKDTTFLSLVMFSSATFKDEANFSLTQSEKANEGFRGNSIFSSAHFEKKANFASSFFCEGADFEGAIFESQAIFSQAKFEENVNFKKIQIKKEGELDFSKAKIGKKDKDREQKYSLNFDNATFEGKANFSSTHFYNETYFHRAIFHQDIQFYRSYFEGIANFYFADFKGIPNFSMCVFNQPKFANFVGVVLPQNTIDKLEEYINQKAGKEAKEKDNTEKGRTKTYLCIQHSLNIRDSFRVIKETLIAQGNLLDTQQWQKLELYAKELECKYRIEISTLKQEIEDWVKERNQETEEEKRKKNQIQEEKQKRDFERGDRVSIRVIEISKDEKTPSSQDTDSMQTLEVNKNELTKIKIEYWQLWFYRNTSDHHTNLAKIINSVIMLIALFGTFAFGLNSLATHNFSTSNIPQKFIFGMLSKTPHSVAFLSLGLLLGIGILTEIWKICKTHLKGIFLSFLWRSIPSMVLFLILCVLVCESFALLPFWSQEMIFIFVLCFSFVGIYLFLLWRESKVWIAISYIISSGILLFKPTLLLPFVGQLFDEGLKTNFPAMQSLSIVYCILMVLMIFSLQKTARKNSIVPS